ncbi:MAG TPA: hypothetical protein VJT82_00435 [Pyrinomonadaceae bacterium]|nr:hypothetical protein [Pyrinomonadaceae bacterium]
MRKERQRIVFPREVLLVEIERHCAECNARARVGLTKEEARLYDGFECERCEHRNDDGLTERDIPDWWEELTVTGLDTLRGKQAAGGEVSDDSGEVVSRLSDAWRREETLKRRDAGDAHGDAGDEQS